MHKSREAIDEQQRQLMSKKVVYYPGDTYPKIQFESGEIAWLKHDNGETLLLVFEDGTGCERLKNMMPEYKVIGRPKKKKH
jgi:hypothetical protein